MSCYITTFYIYIYLFKRVFLFECLILKIILLKIVNLFEFQIIKAKELKYNVKIRLNSNDKFEKLS